MSSEDLGNSLKVFGPETHSPLLVQLPSPTPFLPLPPWVVLTVPYWRSQQPSWPLLVLTALSSTNPLHHQHQGQLTELPSRPSLPFTARHWILS